MWQPAMFCSGYTTDQAHFAQNSGMETFQKEARKMERVATIPQVVNVREVFEENATAYIVMDFVEGETLKDRLKKTGPLSWEEAQKIFLPVVDAMAQVHQAGLIHRDLSPDNLMLQPDGTVRILDLGAAKDLNINSGASSMQVAKGGFSPLEQYTQRGGSGSWTDVYALAATMYYSLTGVLPPAAVDRVSDDPLRWDLPQLTALPKNVQGGAPKCSGFAAGQAYPYHGGILRSADTQDKSLSRSHTPQTQTLEMVGSCNSSCGSCGGHRADERRETCGHRKNREQREGENFPEQRCRPAFRRPACGF